MQESAGFIHGVQMVQLVAGIFFIKALYEIYNSRFATEGFMQTLADELDTTSTIRVNSLNPGPTRTKMRALAYPAEPPDLNPRPEDIINAYIYLIGPDSKGVTGQAHNAQ